MHGKLSEARLKIGEVEKVRQALEARIGELDSELSDKVKAFAERNEEFDKVKKEYDRVKEILSYVKSNC